MDIFEKVGKGQMAPAKAEARLKGLGLSKGQAVKDVGSFFEGLEKTAGVGFRRVKSAELVNVLHKIPDRGSAGWTDHCLGLINGALGKGHISGPQFLKLRGEVLQGTVEAARKADPSGWPRTLATWAGSAATRRLISAGEKRWLEEQAGGAR